MNRKKQLLFLLIACLLLMTSCAKVKLPTNVNTAFENFTLCLFQQEVSSNTINLHYSLQEPEKFGITDAPITLGSFEINETASLATIENLEQALQKFPYSSLSRKNQITYDVLSYYLSMLKQDVSYYLYGEPLSPLTGTHAQLPVLLAEYQFASTKDVETYLSLLETMPAYFASLAGFEQQKSSAGLFMSDASVDAVIEQCNAFVAMGSNNYLLTTFESRLDAIKGLSKELRQQYISKNSSAVNSFVLPAYESLALSLASLKGTGKTTEGLCSLPKGKEYYAHLVAVGTGSERAIPALKVLIQKQISTDLLDSQKVLSENPDLMEQSSSLQDSPEQILANLKQNIYNSFPESPSVNVTVKHVPSALENYLSPAFYLIPAIDNFQENTIYINQAHATNDIRSFTTLAHEGYPGHLYQTTYFASTHPDPLRSILSFQGYVEGWATYAEMCSYYISPFEKPLATVLQKNNSLILGLYAAADIGIHYDGWSLSDTISFFQKYGITDAAVVQEIYEHIVCDPANYLTYYVGYLEFLELKKEVMNLEKDNFSQKEFHKKVLEIGPAPFEILRKYALK